MPQKQSAKKALKQSEKHRLLNNRYKKKMRSLIKELQLLIKKGKNIEAKTLLPQVYKAIDKTAKKGIIKKGNASRKKSRLTKAINKIGLDKKDIKVKPENPKTKTTKTSKTTKKIKK
ncbi:30S ribosomal protein S20 [bacterium]|nr:MAG: 30S ribosomal protein S20 [bacterium]